MGVLSMGSRRGGGVARGDGLADDEGSIGGVTTNEGVGSSSRSATIGREVVGTLEGGGGVD